MTNTESSNQRNNSGLINAVLFSTVIFGNLIWIVGLLSLGLAVDGIGTVFQVGFAIAVTGGYSLAAQHHSKTNKPKGKRGTNLRGSAMIGKPGFAFR